MKCKDCKEPQYKCCCQAWAKMTTTKDHLRELLEGLNDDDLRTLRAIINGKISKRKITPEQQAKMQEGRKKDKS